MLFIALRMRLTQIPMQSGTQGGLHYDAGVIIVRV